MQQISRWVDMRIARQKIRIFSIGVIILLTFIASSKAQRLTDLSTREYNIGLNFNTNGAILGGFVYSYYRKVGKNARAFSFELVEVRQAKEQKYTNLQGGQVFLYAKENHLYSLRTQYGRRFLLFNKYPDEGVKLSLVLTGGPTFGFLKPYYVDYDFSSPTDTVSNIKVVPFEYPELSPEKVRGAQHFFRGFGKMKVMLGLSFKAGVNFEFSRNTSFSDQETVANSPSRVSGIEIGFGFETFQNDVPIMAIVKSQNTFTSLYFNLYTGRKW